MLLKKRPVRKPLIAKVGEENFVPIALMGLTTSSILLFFAFGWIAIQLTAIANRASPTLVQSSLGESFVARPQDYVYRDPKLLQNTAKEWAMLTFSWGEPASSVPGSADLIKYGQSEIPLSAYKASMLISDSFRSEFLDTYTAEIFTTEAARGMISSLYVPLQVLPPEEVSEGRWIVEVLGSRYITTPQNPSGKMKPANFRIELKASDVPTSPLGEDASPTVKAVYSLFESGLRITDITETPDVRR